MNELNFRNIRNYARKIENSNILYVTKKEYLKDDFDYVIDLFNKDEIKKTKLNSYQIILKNNSVVNFKNKDYLEDLKGSSFDMVIESDMIRLHDKWIYHILLPSYK